MVVLPSVVQACDKTKVFFGSGMVHSSPTVSRLPATFLINAGIYIWCPNSNSREKFWDIEARSTSYPELMLSILLRKSSTLSLSPDCTPVCGRSQLRPARPKLSTAILALSKSPKHDVYVSPMLLLSTLLASTASKSNSGSMYLRSANANGFEGFERVCVRSIVVAETKMWRPDLRLSLCHTC